MTGDFRFGIEQNPHFWQKTREMGHPTFPGETA